MSDPSHPPPAEPRAGRLRRWLGRLPLVGALARRRAWAGAVTFEDSRQYWEERYALGGTSGRGSYGELGAFKAGVLTGLLQEYGVRSAIEFGCGDGSQLALVPYPRYVGLDVSPSAIRRCAARFANDSTKSFFWYDPEAFVDGAGVLRSDLALSLDVIYHLVEDAVFERYMRHLFAASSRIVVVYSSDTDAPCREPHIRHRKVTAWVAAHQPEWRLVRRVPNPYPVTDDHRRGSFADFFIFERA
jgi:hypothetical protein